MHIEHQISCRELLYGKDLMYGQVICPHCSRETWFDYPLMKIGKNEIVCSYCVKFICVELEIKLVQTVSKGKNDETKITV